MSVEIVSDQSPKGMSTGKKWLIGCGGCLTVLIILAVVAGVAISTTWNNLQKGSSESVKKLFGESYNSAGYLAFGLPLNKPVNGSMVMMMSTDQSTMIFALDTEGLGQELSLLQKTDDKALQAFFNGLGKDFLKNSQASQSSTGKFEGLEFQKPHFVTLSAQKRYPVVYAVMETKKNEQTTYIPVTAALIPVSNQRAVLLLALSPSQSSTVAGTPFEAVQKELEEKLNQLVKDSELDDRLLSTMAEKAAK
ncbi:hypothetical protein [Vampirovibrio chlorellavorus]|uniref:hypothetical protein n=1 Tax=Vampirovibrio chlorellavorus TaxID=758823 RepID=UPI0026ED23F9|nr:hypothetical protein [Vampirovibrio chlorellavorus]